MEPAAPGTPLPSDGSSPPTIPVINPEASNSHETLAETPWIGPTPSIWTAGTTALGRYRLIDRLGQGGMGVVWKVWDEQLARVVALKQVHAGPDPDGLASERFLREARLAARLRHPAIVAVHDVGTHEGRPYFTCDFIEGRTLAQALVEGPPRRIIVAWLRTVAEALHYAHGAGVVHRDVKSANILLDRGGQAYITDFGLAKETLISAEDRSNPISTSGLVLGTPFYMSPEQAGGKATVGPASDQFSLGVVMYEALTGRRPFEGTTVFDVVLSLLGNDPVPPRSREPRIHTDLEAICLKALEKDPKRRYASMADMATDLGRYLEGEPIEARPVTGFTRLRRRLARQKVAVIALFSAVVLAAGAGTYAFVSSRSSAARTEDAEALLAKSQAVSRVLARWSRTDLPPAARVVGEDSLSPDASDEREEATRVVEAFLRDTPTDSASRSAAQALAAWTRFQIGDREEALRGFAEAASTDMEVPLGPLLEALARLQEILLDTVYPLTAIGNTSLKSYLDEDGAPGDPDAWTKVLACLDEARARRVWGREEAEDLRALVEAIRALQRGARSEAESGLDRAVTAPSLTVFEAWLRFTRGVVRLGGGHVAEALRDFERARALSPDSLRVAHMHLVTRYLVAVEGAGKAGWATPELAAILEDCEALLARLPTSPELLNLRGGLTLRTALDVWDRGEDPTGALDRAARDFDLALRGGRVAPATWANRATTHAFRAHFLLSQGGDPSDAVARAVDDASRAISLDPANPHGYNARAMSYGARARWKTHVGQDAVDDVARGVADCDTSIEQQPGQSAALETRAALWLQRAEIESSRGEDPLPSLERAEADLSESLEIAPGPNGWAERAGVRLWRAEAEAEGGGDPGTWAGKAVVDATEALRIYPRMRRALVNRARGHMILAEVQARRGDAPWESCALAMEDADAAGEAGKEDVDSRVSRGLLLLRQADLEFEFERDPTKTLERAILDLSFGLERFPMLARAWQDRSSAYINLANARAARGEDPRGEYRRAIEDLDRCVALDPEDILSLCDRASAYTALAEAEQARGGASREALERAVTECDKVIKSDPGCPTVWTNRGAARLALSREATMGPEEALAHLDRAIEDFGGAVSVSPGRPEPHVFRARARARKAKALADAGQDAAPCVRDAFTDIETAIDAGWRDAAALRGEGDLRPLHADPRWEPLLKRLKTR